MKRAPIKPLPSQDCLRELFDYNPETGVLSWKVSRSNRVKVGGEAGRSLPNGYREVRIDLVGYYTHRLVWCWMTGEDPGVMQIDHIDRNKSNNSWVNLRLVDSQLNAINVGLLSINESGVAGVSKHGIRKGYDARIKINKRVYRKYFKTFGEAVEWRKDMEIYREKLLLSR